MDTLEKKMDKLACEVLKFELIIKQLRMAFKLENL